jgi:hypothetical protein
MLSLCALTVAMSVVSQPRLAVHVEKTTLPEAAALDRELTSDVVVDCDHEVIYALEHAAAKAPRGTA